MTLFDEDFNTSEDSDDITGVVSLSSETATEEELILEMASIRYAFKQAYSSILCTHRPSYYALGEWLQMPRWIYYVQS